MENLNRSITSKETGTGTPKPLNKKSLGPDGPAGEFYQTLKESMPTFSNSSKKLRRREPSQAHFMSPALPWHHSQISKDTEKKKNVQARCGPRWRCGKIWNSPPTPNQRSEHFHLEKTWNSLTSAFTINDKRATLGQAGEARSGLTKLPPAEQWSMVRRMSNVQECSLRRKGFVPPCCVPQALGPAVEQMNFRRFWLGPWTKGLQRTEISLKGAHMQTHFALETSVMQSLKSACSPFWLKQLLIHFHQQGREVPLSLYPL